MKEFYTIGEISSLYGINYRTLRYYDEIGLLKPEYTNPETNYRYYSTRQFVALNNILYLRELGVPVRKIKEALETHDPEDMLRLFRERKDEVDTQIGELEIVAKKAENRINYLEDALSSKLDVIERTHFPERRLAVRHQAFKAGEDIEPAVQSLAGRDPKNFTVFLGKAGLILGSADLKAGNFCIYSAVCIILDDEDRYDRETELLPESDALSLRFRGTHADAPKYYRMILEYIDREGLDLNGDALEVTLIDYCLTDDESMYVTEIQIPVRKKPSLPADFA